MENYRLTYLDAKAKAKIFNEYAENFESQLIVNEGFNPSNGVLYIVLENGIHICASYAKTDVFFVIKNDDSEDGQITFYDIDQLKNYLSTLKTSKA